MEKGTRLEYRLRLGLLVIQLLSSRYRSFHLCIIIVIVIIQIK